MYMCVCVCVKHTCYFVPLKKNFEKAAPKKRQSCEPDFRIQRHVEKSS